MVKKTELGRIIIDRELCKGCYLCISVCPNNLIAVSDKLNQMGYSPVESKKTEGKEGEPKCTGCAMCAIVCPDLAIEVYRE